MANGETKRIDQVEEGDYVLATDPETGETGAREVIATLPHTDQLLTLRTSSGEIVTTEDHKYWNDTDQAWQESQDLDPGDRLLTADGDEVTVEGLDWTTVHTAPAYDLTVAEFHSFYVGVGYDEVLVHNCTGPRRPAVRPEKPTDPPSWVKNEGHYAETTDLNPADAATRIMNEKYPDGWSGKGAGSEYSQLQKWLSRYFDWS